MDLDLSMAPPARKPQEDTSPALDLSMAPAAAAASRPDFAIEPSLEPAARRSSLPDIFTRDVDITGFSPQASADVLNGSGPSTLVLERALMRNSQPATPYVQPEKETTFDRLAQATGYESDFAEHTGFGGVFGSAAKQVVRAVPVMAKSTNEALAMGAGVLDSAERGLGNVLGTGSTGMFGVARNWLMGQSEVIRQRILSAPELSLPVDKQGRLWDKPGLLLDPEWLTFNTGDAAVSMAPMIFATVMSGGSTLVGAVVGAAQEAGDLYRELVMEDKADPDRALAASLVFGVAVSGLNKLGLDKIMDKRVASTVFAKAAKAAMAGSTEAVTEWMEEPIQAALQGMANNESAQQVQGRILEALKNVDVMPGSFILGGGAHHVNQRAEQVRQGAQHQAQGQVQAPAQEAATQQPGAEAQAQQPDQAGQPTQPAGPGQNAAQQAQAEQILPSGEDVMPHTREDAHEALTRHYGEEQASPVIAVWDAIADSWAERMGSTREAFYEQNIAGIVSPPGHVTPEAPTDFRPDPQTRDPQAGMDAAELRRAIAPLQENAVNALPLDVVQGVQELPAHLRADAEQGGGTPSAVYDPQTGRVYMMADAIKNAEQAVGLWMHEQGAHVGLRGLLGEHLDPFLDRVAEHVGTEALASMAELHGLDLETDEGRRHAAEEHLASLAERVRAGEALSEQEQTVWNQLVSMLREWLKSVGVVNAEAISEADINKTLHAAIRWTIEGDGQGAAHAAAAEGSGLSNAQFQSALRQQFRETLKYDPAYRLVTYLRAGYDPATGKAPDRTSKNYKPGPGLNLASAREVFGKEVLERVAPGLLKKDSRITVDQLVEEWNLSSPDEVLAALQYNKGKAEAKYLESGASGMLYQGAMLDKALDYGQRVLTAAQQWAGVVDKAISGKLHERATLKMGQMPDALVELGAPAVPLTMRKTTFEKITGRKPDPRSGHEHELTDQQVKDLYAALADPVAVMRPVENKMEVVVEMLEKGKPVLVAIDLAVVEGRVEINSIATAFGHEHMLGQLIGARKQGTLAYFEPKRYDALEDKSDNLKQGEPASVRVLRARQISGSKIKFAGDIVKPVFDAKGTGLNQDAAPGESKFSGRAAKDAGPRAAIQFLDDGRAIIHLFRTADASSIIHETGHLLRPLLPQVDQAAIEKWAGVKDGQWTREAEEKFAKGFEVYCYEGKAPTSRLRRVFSTLRNMLVRVYGSIRNIGGVQITPEVRQVFDRMLSTQAEREAEAQAADAAHSFHVDPEAGLPGYDEALPASFQDIKEYEDLMAAAERLAYERFDMERRKEHRTLRAEWRREARDVVDSFLPHQTMDAAIALGGLDHGMVSEAYDTEFVRLLTQKRPGLVRRDSGVSPEAVALEHGYTDAHAMMEDFLDVPGKEQIVKDYMEHREEAYQRQRALDKDFGGDYMAVQDAAMEILGKLTRVQNLRVETAQARATVDELRLYDLGKLRAQARGERMRLQDQAKAAFDAGDPRRAQLLLTSMRQNDMLLREMERALAERDKMERSARTMLSRKIEEDWRQQARNWAGLFGLGGAKTDGVGPELLDFLAAKGLHHFVDQDAIANLARAPRGALSVDQYRDVHRVLRQIIHFGTWDTLIMGQQKAQQFDDVMGQVLSTILAKGPGSPGVNIHPEPPSGRRRSPVGEMLDGVAAYHAELLKPEHIFRQLDGQADMGPVWTHAYKPIVDSRGDFLRLGEEVQAKLQAAFAPVHKELGQWRKQRITISEVPRNVVIKKGRQIEIMQGAPLQLTMEEIVMVGLNSGNEGNRRALIKGFQWTEGDMEAILARLGQREWAVVHQVWDAIEAIYPHLNRAHKRLTGVDLKKVQATPFTARTKDGQQIAVRGGYFPLLFDRELSAKADRQQAQAEMQDLFQSIYQKPNPKSGFTKERVGGQMAPRLDFGVIARHVLDTAHYATHAVAIRDVQKITTDPRFREAVEAAWSRPVYEQIAPWLQNVARPAKEERTKVERFFARARRNVQIVAMGWKPFTAALQLTSLTSTARKVGFWNTVRGVSSLIAHPHESAAFVGERSIALRNRRNSFDRDVVDMLGQFDPSKTALLDRVHKTAFALIGMVDAAVAYATWQAAYTQAMEQNGWDEEKACEFADMTVRLSQGDGAAMSLAQVQHGSELRKFVTMFYSWFSANYNNIAEANRRAYGEGATLPSAVELAKAYWWLLLAPAVLEQLLRHGPPDDEKEARDMGVSIFSYFMASFPVLRSMVDSAVSGRRFQVSPIEDALETPTDLANAFKAKKERGRKVVKTALLGAGYLWGLPTRQAVTVMDAALDMAAGKTKNPMRFLVPAQKDGKKSVQRVSYGGN